MDWSNPSRKQIEMLVTGMKECFPDSKSLQCFLDFEDDKFRIIMPILPLTVDKLLRFYVERAIEQGFVGELYERLKEMPRFAKSLEDQRLLQWAANYQQVEEMKRRGAWPTPKATAVAVEPNWDELSGKQLKVLREAIEKAYPNPRDFDLFLSDIFNNRPLSTHSAAGGFPHQLHDFLKDVQAEGWAKKLVEGLEATKRQPLKNLTSDLEKAAR